MVINLHYKVENFIAVLLQYQLSVREVYTGLMVRFLAYPVTQVVVHQPGVLIQTNEGSV
jgi:hypothetical protein